MASPAALTLVATNVQSNEQALTNCAFVHAGELAKLEEVSRRGRQYRFSVKIRRLVLGALSFGHVLLLHGAVAAPFHALPRASRLPQDVASRLALLSCLAYNSEEASPARAQAAGFSR